MLPGDSLARWPWGRCPHARRRARLTRVSISGPAERSGQGRGGSGEPEGSFGTISLSPHSTAQPQDRRGPTRCQAMRTSHTDNLSTKRRTSSGYARTSSARPDRAKQAPAIVFFFGGGWTQGHPKQFFPHCIVLAEWGVVAMSAEYRIRNHHGVAPFQRIGHAASRQEVASTGGKVEKTPGLFCAYSTVLGLSLDPPIAPPEPG